MTRKKDILIVNNEDLVDLDKEAKDLPYLKCIDLVLYTPQHFGLEKWQSQFVIPDSWMKKLYKNEVYIDTEVEQRSKFEELDDEQKKILSGYLKTRERFEESSTTRKFPRTRPPVDQLVDDLERIHSREKRKVKVSFSNVDRNKAQQPPLSESKSSNIAICRKHKVQSEVNIVEKAIDKMKDLSPEEEEKYQNLLKDEEFMKLLNSQVENYLKSAQ